MCGEGLVGPVSRSGGVGAYDPEMIGGVCTQARDLRKDIMVSVPSLGSVGRSGSVACCPSVLKVHGGDQSAGINGAVKCG